MAERKGRGYGVRKIISLGPKKAEFETAFVKLKHFTERPTNAELEDVRADEADMWMCRWGRAKTGQIIWLGLSPKDEKTIIGRTVKTSEATMLDQKMLANGTFVSYKADDKIDCLCDGFLWSQLPDGKGLTNQTQINTAIRNYLIKILKDDSRTAKDRRDAHDENIDHTRDSAVALQAQYAEQQKKEQAKEAKQSVVDPPI